MSRTPLEEALRATLTSPNEFDSNGETANVVDGLFAIAREIGRLARAVEMLAAIGASHKQGSL